MESLDNWQEMLKIGKQKITLSDIEKKIELLLDEICTAYLSSPIARQPMVLPSVISAVQDFLEIPLTTHQNTSWLIKHTVTKALRQISPQISDPQKGLGFPIAEIEMAVKNGCKNWLNKVFEENNITL